MSAWVIVPEGAKRTLLFLALSICGTTALAPVFLFLEPFADSYSPLDQLSLSDAVLIAVFLAACAWATVITLKAGATMQRRALIGTVVGALVAVTAGRVWPYSQLPMPHIFASTFGFDGEAAESANSFEYYFEIWLLLAVASAAAIWLFRKIIPHR